MAQEVIAVLLDEVPLTLDQFAGTCRVERQWIVERVRSGLLLHEAQLQTAPEAWQFTSRDVVRARRMLDVEHRFDANAELAALVADLMDELESLRAALKR
ncbi:MerR family transcriptional regulator [Oxalobacteraceae bacterium OM1]|nr:MerR family transcriptional regulator [Oxalobacteraceae bacterium OM1]